MSELIVRISADIKQLEKGYEQAAKQTEALQGRLEKIGKASGLAFAAGATAIGLAINAYQKAAIEDNKLRATLEATGGAAGLTFEQIKKMGDQLSILTGIEDETINASQSLLLSFNKIGKEAFPEALKSAADLSVLMGTDLKSATLQVGKALQDPVEGLSSLGRVGVKFSEDQKAVIQSLVESGRQAEAQAIILETLAGRVGGLAEGAAKGKEGINLLTKTFGDFSEEIGSKFAPILNSAALILGNFFKTLADNKTLVTTIAVVLGVGTALAGLVTAAAAAGVGLLVLRTSMIALQAVNLSSYFLMVSGSFKTMASTILGLIPNLIRGVIAFGAAINTSLVGSFKALPVTILKAQFAMGAFFSILKTGALNVLAFAGSLVTTLPAAIKAGIAGLVSFGSTIFTTTNLLAVLRVGINLLVGATGIGLIVVVLSTLLFSWESTWKGIKDITFAAIDGIKGVLGGLADVLVGVFTFDGDKVAAGWEQIKTATVNAANQTIDAVKEVVTGRSDELAIVPGEGGSGADKKGEDEKEKTAYVDDETKKRIQLAKDEREILKAQALEVSQEEQDFITRRQELRNEAREAELIKNEEEKALAIENLRLKNEALILEEQEYQEKRAELIATTREQDAALQEELRALSVEERAALDEEDLQALRDKIMTEQEIEAEAARQKVERGIEANNQRLRDQQRFGVAYSKINAFIQSEEVQGALAASNQLVALTQSKNNTLKSIGKAAALSQNIISTAQGATSAYASLAPIPFVGPALGIAAAAAMIAFGAERASNILAANTGGIVTGGIPGVDSVPAMLTPGELVVPERNFDQVVGAVRGENQGGGDMNSAILLEISQKLDNVGNNITVQGDVLAEEVFIDRLVDKINEGINFRNLQLGGA